MTSSCVIHKAHGVNKHHGCVQGRGGHGSSCCACLQAAVVVHCSRAFANLVLPLEVGSEGVHAADEDVDLRPRFPVELLPTAEALQVQ